MQKCKTQGGVRNFFSVFSCGTKTFCLNFMGYEIFFGILEFHSALVPGIRSDRSLRRRNVISHVINIFSESKTRQKHLKLGWCLDISLQRYVDIVAAVDLKVKLKVLYFHPQVGMKFSIETNLLFKCRREIN